MENIGIFKKPKARHSEEAKKRQNSENKYKRTSERPQSPHCIFLVLITLQNLLGATSRKGSGKEQLVFSCSKRGIWGRII